MSKPCEPCAFSRGPPIQWIHLHALTMVVLVTCSSRCPTCFSVDTRDRLRAEYGTTINQRKEQPRCREQHKTPADKGAVYVLVRCRVGCTPSHIFPQRTLSGLYQCYAVMPHNSPLRYLTQARAPAATTYSSCGDCGRRYEPSENG